jgi:hypothetical protein
MKCTYSETTVDQSSDLGLALEADLGTLHVIKALSPRQLNKLAIFPPLQAVCTDHHV